MPSSESQPRNTNPPSQRTSARPPVHFPTDTFSAHSPTRRPSDRSGSSNQEVAAHEADEEAWPSSAAHRRQSTLHHLTDIGGVNSIRSFTRSWARAAGFAEVIPRQIDNFVLVGGDDQDAAAATSGGHQFGRSGVTPPSVTGTKRSLLREHFEAAAAAGDDTAASPPKIAVDDTDRDEEAVDEERPLLHSGRSDSSVEAKTHDTSIDERIRTLSTSSGVNTNTNNGHSGSFRRRTSSIFAAPPWLASPDLIVGSHGSHRSRLGSYPGATYGSISATTGREEGGSMAEANELWRQHQATGDNAPDGETEPILVKEVEQDGRMVLTVEGQSTLPQTVFNSINVLIGVGLLSLPMGIKYAGWLCGLLILLGAALITSYTAKLLAKCMDLDASLITFSDLAYISFGSRARIATSLLFTLELLAACVALVVLFADSMVLLFDDFLDGTEWKIMFCLVLIPLNFLPLRWLSFTSILGILACIGIVSVVIIDGLIKPDTPGSLREPAVTYLFPANWFTLPLSFGLLMSPWGGHSVFPNIYRDMRHPYKYTKALKVTFSFTYFLDLTTAVAGLLMFGDAILPAIPSNIILMRNSYPPFLTVLMCFLIGIIPLTKIPLNARPIISTADVLLGIHQRQVSDVDDALVGQNMYVRGVMKVAVRVLVAILFLVISVVFPAFDSIMAFMGSALCFTICIILPVAFHLKLFGHEISQRERWANYGLIAICVPLSIVGTVWAILPKSMVGAE